MNPQSISGRPRRAPTAALESLISFEAVVEASKHGRFHVRLRNGHRLNASTAIGLHPPGLEGRVELSFHPCGGWRFTAKR